MICTRIGGEPYKAWSSVAVGDFCDEYRELTGKEPFTEDVAEIIEYAIGTALVALLTDVAGDGMDADLESLVVSMSATSEEGLYDIHANVTAYPPDPELEDDCE